MQQVKFIECPSDVPIVMFSLGNGATAFGVVDTASETTVFDMGFVKENKAMFKVQTTDELTNIVGVNNSKPVPLRTVVADVTLDGTTYPLEGMTFEVCHLSEHFQVMYDMHLNIELILGSDFLKKHNAKINFEEGVLVIDDISGK